MLAPWLVYVNRISFNLDLLMQKYNNVNKYLFQILDIDSMNIYDHNW